MAIAITLVVLLAFLVGYRFYASWIGRRIYDDQEDLITPAYALEDGRDFVPTDKHILFGHHFTSIAGAAPIIGPCVAAYWGWLPALVWVVLGTLFMGAVHDFGALVVSIRERGRSIADIAGKVVSERVRIMFLSFVLVLSWLVLAVFAMAIAGLFVAIPTSVWPVNIGIVVALGIGVLIYRMKVGALLPSLVALVLLYVFVWYGAAHPVDLTIATESGGLGWTRAEASFAWILALFGYSAVASLLPVWLLLQPRDFVNSHQLVVGLGLIFLGLFVANPVIDAPMFRASDDGAPSIFPLLFVTVACGAISGFHGLVSSGTTSKQIKKLSQARLIGYGSMLGEGTLALAATMAAVAGIGLVTACTLPGQGVVSDLSWSVYYDTWAHAGANKATAFVLGGGAFLESLGIGSSVARTLMAVLVISFASTTLDTATRIERMIIAELGTALRVKWLTNPYLATFVAVVPAILLATYTVEDPASGETTEAGWVLWPIFGASNQMIAALTLMILALYFWQRRRPVLPLVLPMMFVTVISLVSLVMRTRSFLAAGNWPLCGLSALLLSMIVWMLAEGALMYRAAKRARQQGPPASE
ncbi:MAG: carbon starvation protein A [Nannocystaceae bacterium]